MNYTPVYDCNAVVVMLLCADRCNYNCSHCIADKKYTFNDDWFTLLSDMLNKAKRHIRMVICGTGEPLLMSALLPFVRSLPSFPIEIVSNTSLPFSAYHSFPNNVYFSCSCHLEHTTPMEYTEKVVAISERHYVIRRFVYTGIPLEPVIHMCDLPYTVQCDYESQYESDLERYRYKIGDKTYRKSEILHQKLNCRNNFCNAPDTTVLISTDGYVGHCVHDANKVHITDYVWKEYRPPVYCSSVCHPCDFYNASFDTLIDCIAYQKYRAALPPYDYADRHIG